MTAMQMRQLVDNLKRDGNLTSLPLVYPKTPELLEIISGHHRVEASIKAGFETIDVLVVLTPLDEKRITAIQLSHNAISGQDNRSILAELYGELDLDARKYSGLTDEMLGGFDKLGLVGLGVGMALYEDLHVSFLPDDREQFLAFLKRIASKGKGSDVLVARFADFDQLFETLIRTKSAMNVQNVGIALHMMAQLATERLDQMETEQEADGQGDDEAGGAVDAGRTAPGSGTPDHKPSRKRAARKRRHSVAGGDEAGGEPADPVPVHPETPAPLPSH